MLRTQEALLSSYICMFEITARPHLLIYKIQNYLSLVFEASYCLVYFSSLSIFNSFIKILNTSQMDLVTVTLTAPTSLFFQLVIFSHYSLALKAI